MTVSTKHYVAVNLGSGPNTGTGDDLLTAFNKINQNFGNYESVGFPTGDISASGTVQAAYFVGDGSQLTAIPTNGLYSNANVASYMATYSGNVANVTVTGNITLVNPLTSLVVSGNTYLGGAMIESGYQQYKPIANVAVTANVNVTRILLHPTGTIISFGANVTLPNTQVDGTIISISSNVTIASLDVRPNWNGVVTVSPFGNTSSVTAGTVNRFMYIAADKVWYKVA
jgi:hypothetical protein